VVRAIFIKTRKNRDKTRKKKNKKVAKEKNRKRVAKTGLGGNYLPMRPKISPHTHLTNHS